MDEFMKKFNVNGYDFICEHIPYFSAITVCYKDTDVITTGIDWDYVEITDEILDCDEYIYKNHNVFNEIISNLLKFVYSLGNAMYSDIFDSDALVSSSQEYLVSKFLNHKNIGWKAIEKNQLEDWVEENIIPKDTVFSLAKYFYVERNKAIDDSVFLVKLKPKKYNISIRRNSTFKIKDDISISDVEFNARKF